jgi:hypothetical protein
MDADSRAILAYVALAAFVVGWMIRGTITQIERREFERRALIFSQSIAQRTSEK